MACPAGTTGESPTLVIMNIKKLLNLCIKESNGKNPVIAGTGSNSTDEAYLLQLMLKKQELMLL